MSISHDDPRLTAYALGELSPEELAEFELLLARDARAQAEVAAIAELGARLTRELSRASSPALSERRRSGIHAALQTRSGGMPERVTPMAQRSRRSWWLLAAMVPALGLVLLLSNPRESESPGPTVALSVAAKAISSNGSESNEPAANLPEPIVVPSLLAPATEDTTLDELNLDAYQGQGLALNGMDLRADVPRYTAANADPRQNILPPPGQNKALTTAEEAPEPLNRESYDVIEENPFVRVDSDPRSTFSIDVDTASYALVRRFLQDDRLPPRGAVRIEELVNYFSYHYPQPSGDAPVAIRTDVARAPWNPEHQLLRVALQARHVDPSARPPANLVFLIDVSGSMLAANKLDLVKFGLRELTETLGERDRVSIVTYAGNSGMALAPTAGSEHATILQAIERLEAGGSTNGAAGIELAYSLARKNFASGNVNRVLLATDGDFNVGTTSQSELVELVQNQAKSGVFLSVLGFGAGNYQDSMLEKLADKGNGNYAYIDQPREARKVLVEQANGTLLTLAKDVKLQLEFNPAEVAGYRLIGYENRKLAHPDFNDDSKDAGELGADHSVTALYELIPAGQPVPAAGVDALKYQRPPAPLEQPSTFSGELANVKLRYQPPAGGASRLLDQAVRGPALALAGDFAFVAAVAEFGMLLRSAAQRGNASYDQVLRLTEGALGEGKERQARAQFVELVRTARRLSSRGSNPPRP
jgi:Ca-activated chloride channel homolog